MYLSKPVDSMMSLTSCSDYEPTKTKVILNCNRFDLGLECLFLLSSVSDSRAESRVILSNETLLMSSLTAVGNGNRFVLYNSSRLMIRIVGG